MANLKPNIGVGEWAWWVPKDTVEAFEAIRVLALLLVDDTETEKNFVRLVEI